MRYPKPFYFLQKNIFWSWKIGFWEKNPLKKLFFKKTFFPLKNFGREKYGFGEPPLKKNFFPKLYFSSWKIGGWEKKPLKIVFWKQKNSKFLFGREKWGFGKNKSFKKLFAKKTFFLAKNFWIIFTLKLH